MGLVCANALGGPLDASHVRRAFRAILKRTTLDPTQWTPRELRHSFVSLLSSGGVSVEEICRLVRALGDCGHRSRLPP